MDDAQQLISGVGVSPGRVTGPVATLAPAVPEPVRERLPLADLEAAAASIGASASRANDALAAAAARPGITEDARAILEATAAMAADPMLTREAVRKVRSEHVPAARAVWEAANEVAEQFAAMGGYLAERVKDIHDVRDRIVADLTGAELPGVPEREEPYVLVATDLSPALTATLDASHVIAIVTVEGGPASHTAILARSRGIPAVVAAADARLLVNGETVIVDGAAGTVTRNPEASVVSALAGKTKEPRAYVRPCQTTDGHRVPILANIGTLDDAVTAAAAGCDGVGLLRTEIAYLDRSEAPSIAEQTEFYRAVLDAFPGRKVVIRTLDAGADKPLPFVTSAPEENPALGVRGLRTATNHPQLLEDQLAAIGAAARLSSALVWVMAPMVATADECADFVARCAAHGIETAGIMVEVPAAALQSSHLLASAAFASIGTNDLTQYTMAADRLSAGVAHLCDPWNPSVLQLIAATCAGGAHNGRPVGVCGEAAADPALAVVLVGLGVDSLSMSPRSMGDVAAVLATVSLAEARAIAATALAARDAASARAGARAALPQLVDLEL